jgi:hypothetical protein
MTKSPAITLSQSLRQAVSQSRNQNAQVHAMSELPTSTARATAGRKSVVGEGWGRRISSLLVPLPLASIQNWDPFGVGQAGEKT